MKRFQDEAVLEGKGREFEIKKAPLCTRNPLYPSPGGGWGVERSIYPLSRVEVCDREEWIL